MRVFAGLAMLLLASVVSAAKPAGDFRQAEASMLVTGRIEVDREGRVSRFFLEQKELPPEVTKLLEGAVPHWQFKPVVLDGVPVNAAADMSIRLVAQKLTDGDYLVAVRSAVFGRKTGKPGEDVASVDMSPPPYPIAALKAGISGTVHLLVKIGRDGRVLDVMAEQVNLSTLTSAGRGADRWRRVLADASVHRARAWKFQPPSEGQEASKESWLARIPVRYSLNPGTRAYGQWQVYLPGPRTPNPWETEDEGRAFSPDALPPGGMYLAGSGLKLLTELSGG